MRRPVCCWNSTRRMPTPRKTSHRAGRHGERAYETGRVEASSDALENLTVNRRERATLAAR